MKRLFFLLVAGCGGSAAGGGDDASTPTTDAAAVPDAATDAPDAAADGPRWAPIAALPAARQECGVAALDGLVYVAGGYDAAGGIVATVEAYDPARDTWVTRAPLPQRLHHVNLAAAGGKLYLLGGLRTNSFTAVGDSYVYDPGADSWTPVAGMPVGSERGASALGVVGEVIYVAGGFRLGAVADFSAYDTVGSRWQALPALPAQRDHLVGGTVGTTFYAISGRNANITAVTARVDAFDTVRGVWEARAPIPTARGGSAAAVVGTRLVVLGGEGNPAVASGVFDDAEIYDTVADRWEVLPPMTRPRHGTGAATVDGKVYMPGGADRQGFAAVAAGEVLLGL